MASISEGLVDLANEIRFENLPTEVVRESGEDCWMQSAARLPAPADPPLHKWRVWSSRSVERLNPAFLG